MIRNLRRFIDSTNFTKAITVTFAAVLPVVVLSKLGYFSEGFAVALGAFLAYPPDIPSTMRHRINGLVATSFIVAFCTLLISLVNGYALLFYPVTLLLAFMLSMISVYGQRATMVSFSGLLALTLATGHTHSGWEAFTNAGLMLAGGFFYTLVSVMFNTLSPHRYSELQIAECLSLTAKYLKLRGDLWSAGANRKDIVEKQLHLQVDINTTHENLREILLRNPNAVNSNRSRKMILVFISLLEILELALSTSFDHARLEAKFSAHPEVLKAYQQLAYNLADALKKLSKSVEGRKKYQSSHRLLKDAEALERAIRNYGQQADAEETAEGVYILRNMLTYAEKQIEKVIAIERALTSKSKIPALEGGRDKDLEKFLKPEYYPLSILKENFSFSSGIFRLSLRLAVTIAIGLAIGAAFSLQNVYWILLTIVVIMRPGYGLTKQRSYQRIIGTLCGGAIAFGFLSFVHTTPAIATLAIVCMVMGFAFTSVNYSIGATFVTIYVICVYSMLTPDITHVIQYRLLDTCVGALLSFGANYFFWPSWEFFSIPIYIRKAIEANRDYLNQITALYNNKDEVPTPYRLARKNAFIETGNLMASYQRMAQEPKTKQKQLPQLYNLAVLNHTLLSSLASLGTYIQSNRNVKVSIAFTTVTAAVAKNLELAISILNNETIAEVPPEDLTLRFSELKNTHIHEPEESITDNKAYQKNMQETQLFIEQLVWMNSLSEKIIKAVKQMAK